MKCLASVAAVSVILLATVPAIAQQGPHPSPVEPQLAYYFMWDGPWGWHLVMMIRPVMLLLAASAIGALIVLLVRGFSTRQTREYPPSIPS